MEAIMCLTLFAVRKDKWNTKEGTGKSMKNALYVHQYGKRHLLGWSDFKQQQQKSTHIALTIFELRGSEGISQSVRQLVSRPVENSVK